MTVVGSSAGGIEALGAFLPTVPKDYPAAIAIVLHRPMVQEDERLERAIGRRCGVPLGVARDGEPIVPGRAYLAPAGVHLAVERDRFRLSAEALENHVRPAIDVLFRTAAAHLGDGVAGVILSGVLDDGTAGLAAVKAAGGFAIVQDPADAIFGDMPRSAIRGVDVDAVVPAPQMVSHLERYFARVRDGRTTPVEPAETVVEPSLFSCPDCGGVLSSIAENGVVRFRCRTGHAFSPETLFSEQGRHVDEALWVALRALVERRDLSRRLALQARDRGFDALARRFERQAELADDRERIVRGVVGPASTALDAAEAASNRDGA